MYGGYDEDIIIPATNIKDGKIHYEYLLVPRRDASYN